MLKKYFIMAIAAGFALVACSEKFDEPEILPAGSDNVHTLSVGIEAGTYTPAEGGTKASMEAVIRVNWTEGDKVSVVNATTGKILEGYLEAKASGVSVTFEGTVTGTINQGDKLYYIYPKLAGNTDAETEFSTDGYNQSLENQTYNNENPGKVCFYGYAEDEAGTGTISKKIQFNLVTAYAHLNMSNLPAKGAPLTSIDISNVNEGFTWKLSSEKTLSAEPYAGSNGISVTCTNYNITQAGNAVVRFALPASAASQQSRVITVNKAYKNDKYTVKELEKASYHNQLYSTWENNVKVTSQGDKTKVDITTSEGSTDVAEGVIPVAEAFNDTKPTEIGIGGVGTVTFDATATNKIKENANNAGSANVFFKVEDVTNDTDVQNKNIVYEVTMKTVDEKGIEVFAEGKAAGEATVTVPLGEEVESVESVKLLNENGEPIEGGVVDDSWQIEKGILTFKVNHFSKYAIEYKLKDEEVDYVAQIGSHKYTSLANAVEAAQNGNTVTLIKDVVLDKPIQTNKTFTLTLNANITPVSGWQTNGNTTDALVIIRRGGNITINGTGKISSNGIENAYAAVKLTNKGESETGDVVKLTVEGDVILEGYYYGICGNGSRHNTEITINGGTIKGTATNDNSGIYHPQAGLLTINGGIIEGSTGIALKGGKLVVNDGTIIGNGLSATFSHNDSGWNNTGDALAVEVCDYPGQNPPQTDLLAEIKGGKFASTNGKPVASYVQPNKSYTPLAGFIFGGLYSGELDASLIAVNHEAVSNSDETYKFKVQQKPYVAQIGSTKYYDLNNAINDVPAGTETETLITMLDNVSATATFTIPSDKNICLELNGKSIFASSSTSSQEFPLFANKGIFTVQDKTDTHKDGTGTGKLSTIAYDPDMRPVPGYATNTITNYGTLNIKSGLVESGSDGKASFAIDNEAENAQSHNSSNKTITLNVSGGRIISGLSKSIRMYLATSGQYDNVIKIENAYIGSLWVQDNEGAAAAKGKLTILNSTFEHDLTVGYECVSEHFSLNVSNSVFGNKVHYQLNSEAGGNTISIDNISAKPFYMDSPRKKVLHNGTVTIKGEFPYGWVEAEDDAAKAELEAAGWRLEDVGYGTWYQGYLKEEGILNCLKECIEDGYEAVCVDQTAGKYEIRPVQQ